MPEIRLDAIGVVAELQRLGWKYEPAAEDELKCKCPGHSDETPSCAVSISKRLFKCHAAHCGITGDFVTFLALAQKKTRSDVVADLRLRYDLEDNAIDSETVERWHQAIWAAPHMLKELRDRAVNETIIRERRLGYDGERITIPVPDSMGNCVNVRKYLPGAPSAKKMKNMRGRGKVRLYPYDQLKYDDIILSAGEIKAIVTAHMLNPHGIGAICATAGEGAWESHLSTLLEGKRVWFAFDIDQGGRVGVNRIAPQILPVVKNRELFDILLPLDIQKYPHGDTSDYWGPCGHSVEDFLQLMKEATKWEPKVIVTTIEDDGLEPAESHLSSVTSADNTGRKVGVRAVVAAKTESPYIVPKTVECDCSRDQALCQICPVYATTPDKDTGLAELTISAQSSGLLGMIDTPKKDMREATRLALGVPACKVVQFREREWYNVEDVRLTPQLSISSRSHDHVMRPAYYVGHGIKDNSSYKFTGRVYPHPKNQQAVLLAHVAEACEDNLDTYDPTDEDLRSLDIFRPTAWTLEAVTKKLEHLYEDLETNVTNIYMRRPLHLTIDLAYHSPLLLPYEGRSVKGWVEVLVEGDSSQGKSDMVTRLMEHYGLGEKVVCKGATVPGLLGGLIQSGSRWLVNWGVIPLHDRRLVVLDELKGATTEVISKLTDMRSSGIAEIPKIERRRTHARTRLIAVSNPRGAKSLDGYSFGVEAIQELIGSLEDIRRFDFVYLVAASQVDPTKLNHLLEHRPTVDHVYSADACRSCILYAWTRKTDQIQFEDEARATIAKEAVRLSTEYTESMPLIDRGSIRLKLARLATSLAARTFSTDESRQVLVVRKCHVEYIAKFIDETYSSTVFGYKDYTVAQRGADKLIDEDMVRKHLLITPFPKDFVAAMLVENEVELRDICDWCGWETDEAKDLLSLLVRKHALQKSKPGYRKSPAFIELLKRMALSDELTSARPEHIKEVMKTREL